MKDKMNYLFWSRLMVGIMVFISLRVFSIGSLAEDLIILLLFMIYLDLAEDLIILLLFMIYLDIPLPKIKTSNKRKKK